MKEAIIKFLNALTAAIGGEKITLEQDFDPTSDNAATSAAIARFITQEIANAIFLDEGSEAK